MYFVTICSKNRSNIFSNIINNVGTGLAPVRLELSPLGFIIDQNWKDITMQYGQVELDEYIIMPNHVHGIIIINQRTGASPVPTLSQIIGTFKSKTSVLSPGSPVRMGHI